MPAPGADLMERLVREFGYPESGARRVSADLVSLPAPVRAVFTTWWNGGQEPSLEVEGYTVARLEREHGMTVIAALLTLGWLTREPERALASLRRGHDAIDS